MPRPMLANAILYMLYCDSHQRNMLVNALVGSIVPDSPSGLQPSKQLVLMVSALQSIIHVYYISKYAIAKSAIGSIKYFASTSYVCLLEAHLRGIRLHDFPLKNHPGIGTIPSISHV